ncbi:MAG: hypothetical protein HKN92_06160 [Chitinophagales bacterium]|nr:hypothetical protein [Chitinophagales bacterium]
MSKLFLIALAVCSFYLSSCNSKTEPVEDNTEMEQLEKIQEELSNTAETIEKETKEMNESLDDLLKEIEE